MVVEVCSTTTDGSSSHLALEFYDRYVVVSVPEEDAIAFVGAAEVHHSPTTV